MDIHQCYSEISHWLGDLDFLEIERRFLKKIIREYIARSGLLSTAVASQMEERLIQLGADGHLLRTDMVMCQSRIELIIKNIITVKAADICHDTEMFSIRLDTHINSFLNFKKELYGLVSQILQLEAND